MHYAASLVEDEGVAGRPSPKLVHLPRQAARALLHRLVHDVLHLSWGAELRAAGGADGQLPAFQNGALAGAQLYGYGAHV